MEAEDRQLAKGAQRLAAVTRTQRLRGVFDDDQAVTPALCVGILYELGNADAFSWALDG